jgi:hypothetical protein
VKSIGTNQKNVIDAILEPKWFKNEIENHTRFTISQIWEETLFSSST